MQTSKFLVLLGFLIVIFAASCQAPNIIHQYKGTTKAAKPGENKKVQDGSSAKQKATPVQANDDDDDDDDNNGKQSKSKSKSKLAPEKNNDKDDDKDDDGNDDDNGKGSSKSKPKTNQKSDKNSGKKQQQNNNNNNRNAAKGKNNDDDDGDDDDNKNKNDNDNGDDDKNNDDDDDDKSDSSSSTPASPSTSTSASDNDNDNSNQNCTPPSIDDFPTDLFTQTQRRFGGILFHIAFAVYLFFAIMMVCDDYFMTSLEIIGQNLNLDQDVAGATFMAAGSSAPEVFISLIGIIMGQSNPGIGAIVGSAMFNILFVVGLCGLFVMGSAKLTMWPFFRDAVFYCIAILLLVLLIRDDKVYWYESFVLLAFYGVYIFFMANNDRFKNMAYEKFTILQQEAQSILPGGLDPAMGAPHNKQFGNLTARRSISKSQSGYNQFNNEDEIYAWGGTLDNIAGQANVVENYSYQNSGGVGGGQAQTSGANKQGGVDLNMLRNADSMAASNTRQIDFDTAALQVMLSEKRFRPRTRFQMAVRRVIDEMLWIKRSSTKTNIQVNMNNFDLNPLNKQNYTLFLTDVPNINEPGGKLNFAKWAVLLPVRILFYFTMPDCRVEKYKKWYALTFGISIFWLAVLSYLIIWMITVIGYTFGLPDSLMAVTLVAAGTSIPDAYTSVIVVKEGMVDMGVSNIIGSNVFDLLIGLALPWFIKSIFNGGYVIINSNGLFYDSMLLYACVFATICVIHIRKWNLDRRTGYLFLSIYSAFVIFSSAIELNVFSFVNPPMCS